MVGDTLAIPSLSGPSGRIACMEVASLILGIIGAVTGVGALTWNVITWNRSGSQLTATLEGHVTRLLKSEWPPEKVIFTVDVVNTGRMPAVVRRVVVVRLTLRWQHVRWLTWWYRMRGREGRFGMQGYPVKESDKFKDRDEAGPEWPQEISPTGYLKVRATMDVTSLTRGARWAQAIVIRGDNRRSYSRRIPMPQPEPDVEAEQP
jgi:hypothetical protein